MDISMVQLMAPTASGKGAVNGIGNARKQLLRNAERRQAARLPDAESFVKYLTKHYHRKPQITDSLGA
jgi:hypothetical protein